jgi:hypothetical protein
VRFLLCTALALAAGLVAVGASAAPSQPRYAVTLTATVRDDVSYTQTTVTEDCRNEKAGSGIGQLTIRTARVGRSTASDGTVRIRLAGALLGGTFTEVRNCRFLPPEKLTGRCGPLRLTRKDVALSFRRNGTNRVAFTAAGSPTLAGRICGVTGDVQLGRLEPAGGRVAWRALQAGQSKVVARGTSTKRLERTSPTDPTLKLKERLTVRWTLTFRRL